MKTRTVEVAPQDGPPTEAQLVICPNCDGEAFQIFFIADAHHDHPHLQCVQCETSFCGGGD